MDHCWDDHYTCQLRLSRFPGIIEADQKYEIYFTGTTPAVSRYVLEGADANDYAIVKVDFSQSILYNVGVSQNGGAEVEVKANAFNKTLGAPAPINISECGHNRYEQQDYIYEFALRRNCTVYLRAQEHLVGLVRLQMSVDQFFEDDFVSKLSYALGITTDQIRVVGVRSGSAVVSYQITSAEVDTAAQRKNLVFMAETLAAQYAAGTLDLGAEILDLINQIISSNGEIITTGTDTYKKKEIHAIVFVLLSLSGIALIIGVIYAIAKMLKMNKPYNEVIHDDSSEISKMDKDIAGDFDKSKISKIEEAKS